MLREAKLLKLELLQIRQWDLLLLIFFINKIYKCSKCIQRTNKFYPEREQENNSINSIEEQLIYKTPS